MNERHDPLCGCEGCGPCGAWDCSCSCELIERVRADEIMRLVSAIQARDARTPRWRRAWNALRRAL